MEPAAHDPVRCARVRCPHGFLIHAPGGGACLWWDPETGEHCDCPGFLHVPLTGEMCHYPRGQAP